MYSEKLTPKASVIVSAGIFGATISLLGIAFSLEATLIAMIILALGLPALLWGMSPTVRVVAAGDGPSGIELRCGRAHIDLAYLGDAKILSEAELHDRMGIKASGRDFVCYSPWVKTALAIDNVDETDPISTWLVCTRHPGRLADVLTTHTPSR